MQRASVEMRLRIRGARSESLRCMDSIGPVNYATTEDSDKTVRMRRLTLFFTGRTCLKVRFPALGQNNKTNHFFLQCCIRVFDK